MNKDLIQSRFAKNLKTYNENARIQKRMAERLVTFLNKNNYAKILEIGCGTGFLTELINNRITFEKLTAIDIVEDCRNYINNINPEIEFINADIEEFINSNNEEYDLIISNATLQWAEDFKGLIKKLESKLCANGELLFSTFGKENFREIYHVIGTTLDYYSQFELEEIFPQAKIDSEIHIMAFESPKDVLKHLQLTGVNAIENKTWTKKDLIKFENGYKNLCSRRPTLTYNPVYVAISNRVKESPTG